MRDDEPIWQEAARAGVWMVLGVDDPVEPRYSAALARSMKRGAHHAFASRSAVKWSVTRMLIQCPRKAPLIFNFILIFLCVKMRAGEMQYVRLFC